MNPGWEYTLWTDDTLYDSCREVGEAVAERYRSFSLMHQKVDLGRFAVLYLFGGVSVDMDTVSLRPLEETPHIEARDFILSRSPVPTWQLFILSGGRLTAAVNNATFLCVPGSRLMRKIIWSAIAPKPPAWWSTFYVIQWTTGPYCVTETLQGEANVCRLPPRYFELDRFHPEAILSHYHTNSWVPAWVKLANTCMKWLARGQSQH